MTKQYNFNDIAKLPMPEDNAAIALKYLEAGTTVYYSGKTFSLDCDVLEGHRFAVNAITEGEYILSWGVPYGTAITDILPGTWLRNRKTLDYLSSIDSYFNQFTANFSDDVPELDLRNIRTGSNVSLATSDYFNGYKRQGRGAGTRNYIVVMGTTAQSAGFARELVRRYKHLASDYKNIDGIVAVAHTEGANSNNEELVLRTLAGFIVHPNVGAIIATDYGSDRVTNERLEQYMKENNYTLNQVLHRFLRIREFESSIEQGKQSITAFLDRANNTARSKIPVSELKIALQCGGSDAFSGISANPLAALIAKYVVQNGGSANLAETDELIGAAHFIISNVRDRTTAQKFLKMQKRYEEMASWHGVSARNNPSGGNVLRGLANIYLKSLGAAMKKHPDMCLDYVIDYAELMNRSGFYFMNSPGNDLESVAGQVASGCNLIYFSTGNGSTTKFPLVPTVKLVTTTGRYRMMPDDMDVNAGKYLDGMPMDELRDELLNLTLEVASGKKTAGEKAHHNSQTQIWRGWRQSGPDGKLVNTEPRNAYPILTDKKKSDVKFSAVQSGAIYSTDRIALIVSTSLCSGGAAVAIAESLNKELGSKYGVRFVGLLHTEGCGSAGSQELYLRTMIGHATHPNVVSVLFLALGCEKTGLSVFKRKLQDMGIEPEKCGWAQIQSQGGMQKIGETVKKWFISDLKRYGKSKFENVSLEHLRVGLTSTGEVSEEAAKNLVNLAKRIVGSDGCVVIPEDATFLEYAGNKLHSEFSSLESTLAYGQALTKPGLHIMANPSEVSTETTTGLCSTGVHLMLAYTILHPIPSHPVVPVIQATHYRNDADDFDIVDGTTSEMLETIVKVASRKITPKLHKRGNTAFQIPRATIFSM